MWRTGVSELQISSVVVEIFTFLSRNTYIFLRKLGDSSCNGHFCVISN